MIHIYKYSTLVILEILLILALFSERFTNLQQIMIFGVYVLMMAILLIVNKKESRIKRKESQAENKSGNTGTSILLGAVLLPVLLLFTADFFEEPIRNNLQIAGMIIFSLGFIIRELYLDREGREALPEIHSNGTE